MSPTGSNGGKFLPKAKILWKIFSEEKILWKIFSEEKILLQFSPKGENWGQFEPYGLKLGARPGLASPGLIGLAAKLGRRPNLGPKYQQS